MVHTPRISRLTTVLQSGGCLRRSLVDDREAPASIPLCRVRLGCGLVCWVLVVVLVAVVVVVVSFVVVVGSTARPASLPHQHHKPSTMAGGFCANFGMQCIMALHSDCLSGEAGSWCFQLHGLIMDHGLRKSNLLPISSHVSISFMLQPLLSALEKGALLAKSLLHARTRCSAKSESNSCANTNPWVVPRTGNLVVTFGPKNT